MGCSPTGRIRKFYLGRREQAAGKLGIRVRFA
jgi:hypothetical protein